MLSDVLRKFNEKLKYRELDTVDLDISRSAYSGTLFPDTYSRWAQVDNDPKVVINNVRTYITTLTAKLSSNPFKPSDPTLNELGLKLRLTSIFNDAYVDILADGYSYLVVGVESGMPVVKRVDSRFIIFNGDDPTLKDSTDVAIFQVVPKDIDDNSTHTFPDSSLVDFDSDKEYVITSHYRRTAEGVKLDIYDDADSEPKTYELTGLDRIPVVRFVGDKVELSDKRWHYRGLYYSTASLMKAMMLAATKIQIRTATSDDDNYICVNDGISNHKSDWQNSGVKTVDILDSNGRPIQMPIPITHDNTFLINAFNVWKTAISDMLGPVVVSSSEAVTREEVIARQEVRDAITNTYLAKVADSISETYRCISQLMGGSAAPVTIVGGFLDNVKRDKTKSELLSIYQLAKESGLNTQGFVVELLKNADLDSSMKKELGVVLLKDPYASPKVAELTGQLQQLTQLNQSQQQQITLLRMQATQRLERQAEYVAMQERVKRADLAFKQWQEEEKSTQAARMELLKTALNSGDVAEALNIVNKINERDPLLTTQPAVRADMNENTGAYMQSVSDQLKATSGGPNVGSNIGTVGGQTSVQQG